MLNHLFIHCYINNSFTYDVLSFDIVTANNDEHEHEASPGPEHQYR